MAMLQAARAMADRLHALSEGRSGPVGLVVPVPQGKKVPMVRHKDGEWTEAVSRQWFKEDSAQIMKYDLGILLYGFFVIDFDKEDQYGAWAAEYPELESAPAERTKKGMHVYFLRCPAVEAAGLYNGDMIDPATHEKASIDRKTVTKTGTGGLLVCAPSKDKVWLPGRSLLELDPPTMSPGLLKKVVAYSGGRKKRANETSGGGRGNKAAKTSHAVVRAEGPPLLAPECDFTRLLELFGFPTGPYRLEQHGTDLRSFVEYAQVEDFFARASESYTCHICGGNHGDRIKGRVKLDGSSYTLVAEHFRSESITKCRRRFTIAHDALAAYTVRFIEQPQIPSDKIAGVVAACVEAGIYFRDVSSPPSVWRLADPAPGWIAHAVLESGAAWRLLLQPAIGIGAWHRKTVLPGLFYEFLHEGAWTASSTPAAEKPPFWFSAAVASRLAYP